MANLELGQCICPLCKSKHLQVIKLSEKSGKPYLNCEECGMQLFARSLESVRILRAMASACDTAAPVAVPKAAAAPVAVPKPADAPKPASIEKSAPPELPTMFDALGSLFSTKTTTGKD